MDVINAVLRGYLFYFLGGLADGGILFGLRLSLGGNGGLALTHLFLGAGQVDHLERDFFPFLALRTVKADPILLDFVFADHLIGSVGEVQANCGGGGRESETQEQADAREHKTASLYYRRMRYRPLGRTGIEVSEKWLGPLPLDILAILKQHAWDKNFYG